MKTFFIFIAAHLRGDRITWADAQFRGLHVNTEVVVCRQFDSVAQSVAHKWDVVTTFCSNGKDVVLHSIGSVVHATHQWLARSFLGRLTVVFFNRQQPAKVRYVFND